MSRAGKRLRKQVLSPKTTKIKAVTFTDRIMQIHIGLMLVGRLTFPKRSYSEGIGIKTVIRNFDVFIEQLKTRTICSFEATTLMCTKLHTSTTYT